MKTFVSTLITLLISATGMSAVHQTSINPTKKDSTEPVKKVSIYDTSAIFTDNWKVNVTFAYENSKVDLKERIPLVDSIHRYSFPIEKPTTSGFGPRGRSQHKGIDIPIKTGEPIVAAFDGKVRYATYNSGGFGRLVIIRHTNGLETYYAHLSRIKVKPNQIVKAGQVIGLAGSTGRSYSPHLHFEVRYHDVAFDPARIFDTEMYCLRNDEVVLGNILKSGKYRPHVEHNHSHDHLANGTIYSIQAGDTLSKIAAREGTSVAELCELNGLRPSSILQVGQEIRVN